MRTLLLSILIYPILSLAGQPAIVTGKVTGASDAAIEFQLDKPYPQVNPETQSFGLNQDFLFKPDLERATLVTATVKSDTFQLFLEPGDELVASIDPSETPIAINFSGKGAGNNKMLYEFHKKFGENFNPSSISAAMAGAGSVDEFESSIFDQRMKQLKFVKEYADKKSVTPGFSDFLNNQISYHYFELLLSYAITKSDDPTGMKASKIPDLMLTEMNSIPLSDQRDMNSPAYRGFVRNYIRYQTSAQNSFVKFFDYSDMLEREYNYALRYLSGEPFNYLLAVELFDFCDKSSPEIVQKLNKALAQSDIQSSYVKAVASKCQAEITAKVEKKEKLEVETDPKKKKSKSSDAERKNQPFTLIDLKGDKVYLEDFKGKVIYVDFWASWCGPCRQQFPYAKELHHMLSPEHLKQVLFLYISIDNDEATWKKAIEKNGIEGFNTLSPGGWSSSAASYFGVSSIPRYVLIDKDGNVADPNAKRPSSGQEIINDIVRLIKQ